MQGHERSRWIGRKMSQISFLKLQSYWPDGKDCHKSQILGPRYENKHKKHKMKALL